MGWANVFTFRPGMPWREANSILNHHLDMVEMLYMSRNNRSGFRAERQSIIHNFYQQCRDMGIKRDE